MRSAAELLTAASSFAGMRALVGALGFDQPVAVEAAQRDALGLEARQVALAGDGPALRVLLLELASTPGLREPLERVARRLASRAPHVLWLVAAVESSGTHAAIIAVAPESGPRVASFQWEPAHVVDSDAETLCALAATRRGDDLQYHARCTELLGREALTRRFYRALETRVSALASAAPRRIAPDDARAIALVYASRLMFLRFLEAKGWLDGDRAFLANQFDACMASGGAFDRRVLRPLFFGTLNTPVSRRARAARAFGNVPFLNGGLFARTPLERRAGTWQLPDDAIGALFDELFARFRFVAREDSATWSEASVDPEMLGRAFESLMAAAERRASGAYYTPHALVAHVADEALASAFRGERAPRIIRVLDPACGSGAFLVHVLERIARLHQDHGDERPPAAVRRDVLARSVFGIDRNPTAVWLCELRLWLSVVVESAESDPLRVPPLPNLDRNIRVGDALSGASFAATGFVVAGSARVESLRARYVRATGARKRTLSRQLDGEERRRALFHLDRQIEGALHARREHLSALRARDLFGARAPRGPEQHRDSRRLRDQLRALRAERRTIDEGGALPFSFHACFAEAQRAGGFDVVLGNPPWVRLHRIPEKVRRQFRDAYAVFRAAPWHDGAAGARVAAGFASQVDLAALFVERGLAVLRDGGTLSFLLPAKLWHSLAGGGVRQLLARETQLQRIEDLAQSASAFDAAVYPSLLVTRARSAPARTLTISRRHGDDLREWRIAAEQLAFDASPGAPWLLLEPRARAAFDRICGAGPSLSQTAFGAPRLGVKSGCNAAFVVRVDDAGDRFATVRDPDGECGSVELEMLRPALRGECVTAWRRAPVTEWIIWTHDVDGRPLARLPTRARAWLGRRYDALATRSDAARSRRWWSLFRVHAADSRAARVVWCDIGRRPRALVLPAGDPTVPLNSCYVVRCPDECDAWAIATILNSTLAAAWLNVIAEPARGGYRRYLGWTVGLLPLPRDWHVARRSLGQVRAGDDAEVLGAVLAAYGLSQAEVAPLLEVSAP